MSEPLAAIGAAQLTKLEGIVARRNRFGSRLTDKLAAIPGILPPVTRPGNKHTYWFYLLRLDLEVLDVSRAEFVEALKAQGVPANAGYIPMPVYRYKVFQNHNFFGGTWPARDLGATTMDYTKVSCPVAAAILEDCVVMPLNEAMSDGYIDKVALAIKTVAANHQR